MATNKEYLAQGYTQEQINQAIAKSKAPAPVTSFSANKEIIAGVNAPTSGMVAPTAPTQITTSLDNSNAVAPVAQNMADVSWNEKQKAFDALNPVGTKVEDIQAPTKAQQDAQAGSLTFQPDVPSTTTTTQKVGEAPKTTIKTENKPQSFYDSSVGREKDILANLNDFYSQGITDPEQLKKTAGYDTADQRKKEIIDAYSQARMVKGEEGWLGELIAGRTAFNPKNLTDPDYRMAKARFDKLKEASSMSDADLSAQYRAGNLSPKVLEDLAKADPVKAKNVLTLNKVNGGMSTNIVKAEEAASNDIVSAFNKLFDQKGETSIKETIYSDPAISSAHKKKTALAEEINALTASAQAVSDEVDNELKGTGATSSYANALKGERMKSINRQITAKEASYNSVLAEMQDLVGWKMKDMEREDKLEDEKRSIGKEILMAKFKQSLEGQGIKTEIIKDEATGKQMLINTQTGETIREFDTGAKPGSGTNLQQIKQTDELGRETVVGYFDPATGKSTYYGANTGASGAVSVGAGIPSGSKSTFGMEGGFADFTGTLARTGNNVGKDTNNPGNIMSENAKQEAYAQSLGAIGKYKSQNGRTYAVFPDMETGMSATTSDLKTKLSGGSSWVTPNTTLGQFASGWTSWPNAKFNSGAAANYAKLTGFSQNTKISDIPLDVLTRAIVANEGVDPSVSANIQGAVPEFAQQFISAFGSGVKQEPKKNISTRYSPMKENLLSKYYQDPSKENRLSALRGGLTAQDLDNYSPDTGGTSIASSYLDLFNKGTMSVEDIYTKIGTSKQGEAIKNELTKLIGEQGGRQIRGANDPLIVSLEKTMEDLQFLKNDSYMDTVVWPNPLARASYAGWATGGKDNYLAVARQFLSSNVLQSLIDAKAKGATFGALSDSELNMLKSSANKLSSRAVYDDDKNVVWFRGSEKAFKAELDKLMKDTALAIEKATGKKPSVKATWTINTQRYK